MPVAVARADTTPIVVARAEDSACHYFWHRRWQQLLLLPEPTRSVLDAVAEADNVDA